MKAFTTLAACDRYRIPSFVPRYSVQFAVHTCFTIATKFKHEHARIISLLRTVPGSRTKA